METTAKKPSVVNVIDAYSGVCLADTTSTIQMYLNRREILRYAKAINKVQTFQGLNQKDLEVFDKIDALTFKHNGMCLKDSLVTKARIKACKKFNVQFIDRDGLVDHMNCMLPSNHEREEKSSIEFEIAEFFVAKLGEDSPGKLRTIIFKLNAKQDLDLEDLNFLSKMEMVASTELDWTIVNSELAEAIDKACKKFGIYFQNLQQVAAH